MKIPKNLNSALKKLSKINIDGFSEWKNDLEVDAVIKAHHGLGRNLRNNWELWDVNCELNIYFNKLGVSHPDDMSSIILRSYHRTINNIDIDLDGQIESIKNYWENINIIINNKDVYE